MADLGDISSFIKEGSVANLDWLDVDEKQYRELDTLPKQNLDIAPDMQALWSHEDKSPLTYLVPNKEAPRTMGDLSQAHGKLSSDDVLRKVVKVARLALMQSNDPGKFRSELTSRFDRDTLVASRQILTQVASERGLLGKYYIDSEDFPTCHQASRQTVDFVKRYAQDARFVVAKDRCLDCIHSSTQNCSVFQKEIVLEVPYTQALADAVERNQTAKGKQIVQASSDSPRDRIKKALLAEDVKIISSAEMQKPVVNPLQFIKATVEPPKVHLPIISAQAQGLVNEHLAWSPEAATGRTASTNKSAMDLKAFDISAFLRREMLKGHGEQELLQSLKLSYSLGDLKATRASWEPLFKEAGYFGTIYSTQETFDDCHTGADFLAKHNPSIKGIVAGGKCAGCIYNKVARCMMYGKRLVAKAEDLYTQETVNALLWEHRQAGNLETGADKVAWGSTPAEAIKSIYRTANSPKKDNIPLRAYTEQEFNGYKYEKETKDLTRRDILNSEITKAASRYLNEGLYGRQLLGLLKSRFASTDIKAATDLLKTVLAEQGLQGIFFVDPTVYDDYSRGCEEGGRLHRARQVPYVKVGPKCSSCIHQAVPGTCSKYAKPLVVDPPYADKTAMQREMLASGNSTEHNLQNLMIPSHSIVAEYAMGSMTIDLNPEPVKPERVSVQMGRAKVDL
jgi:hypothetical protein